MGQRLSKIPPSQVSSLAMGKPYLEADDVEYIQVCAKFQAQHNAWLSQVELCQMIRDAAKRRSRSTIPDAFPDRKWMYRFLQQHEDIALCLLPSSSALRCADPAAPAPMNGTRAATCPNTLITPLDGIAPILPANYSQITSPPCSLQEQMTDELLTVAQCVPSRPEQNLTSIPVLDVGGVSSAELNPDTNEDGANTVEKRATSDAENDGLVQETVVSCYCHAGQCIECQRCRRCGADLSGVPDGKRNKKCRDRPRLAKTLNFDAVDVEIDVDDDVTIDDNSSSSGIDLQTETVERCGFDTTKNDGGEHASYVDEAVVRGPSTPTPPRRSRTAPGFFATLLSPPPLIATPTKRSLPSWRKMLQFFGEGPAVITFVEKKLMKASLRTSVEIWDPDTVLTPNADKQRKVMMNMYMRLLTCMAEILCGSEAATASIELFSLWMKHDTYNNSQEPLLTSTARAMMATTKNSIERRTIRAVLCSSYKHGKLAAIPKLVPGFVLSRGTYSKALQDYECLLTDGTLVKEKWSKKKFQERNVDFAIKFILAADNISFLSWGSKRVKVDGQVYEVPAILRRRDISLIFEQYIKAAPHPQVSRASFYRLCGVLTHGAVQSRRAVDYVTGILVNDTVDTLNRICRALIPGNAVRVNEQLKVVKAWLKYGSFCDVDPHHQPDSYVSYKSCPRHNADFGLGTDTSITEKERSILCTPCTSYYHITRSIFASLKTAGADETTLVVVEDCFHKFDLFMGHRLRVVNQQRNIHALFEAMKTSCFNLNGKYEVLLVIDFKMKVEPLFFRETTAAHYGKRGMTWHGAMARYWTQDTNPDGDCIAVENKVYFDHISSCDNKQDRDAVIAFVEAVVIAIKRDLPMTSQIVVQSDNAACYQNSFIPLMLPIISIAHGIPISRFIHTETQDGKSMLDAHFAQAMRIVKSYVQQEHDCYTPEQLVSALSSGNRLLNSIVELVDYDRSHAVNLHQAIAPIEKEFHKLTGRVNDILYDYSRPAHCTMTINAVSSSADTTEKRAFSINESPGFSACAYAYSGVGTGIRMEISPKTSSCIRSSVNGRLSGQDAHNTVNTQRPQSLEDNRSDDSDEEVNISSDSDNESSDDDSSDSDNEGVENEIIVPQVAQGTVTGVSLHTTSQIRLRSRRWKNQQDNSKRVQQSNAKSKEKSLSAYAKRCLIDLKHAGDLSVIEATDLPLKMLDISRKLAQSDTTPTLPILQQGWAVRPPKGSMYGANYIDFYRPVIYELYQKGVEISSNRLGPGRMQESLQAKYPNRFDIPGQYQIRSEISKLMKAEKTKAHRAATESLVDQVPQTARAADKPITERKRRRRMDAVYANFLSTSVASNPAITPRGAVILFRENFATADGISNEQICNKVSALKYQAKRRKT